MEFKPNVFLIQISAEFGDGVYVPLSVGLIQAYCESQTDLSSTYTFAEPICTRFDLDEVPKRFRNAQCIGLSGYLWNWEYTKALATRIKKSFPHTTIVVGGPQVAFATEEVLNLGCFDIIVNGEGEIAFANILRSISDGTSPGAIPGVACRIDGKTLSTVARAPSTNLDQLPSPYLTGVFDSLWNKHRGNLLAIWETNRGCPFSCAYCYWGSEEKLLRKFEMKRLKKEVLWFESHEIDWVFVADANFGIAKRDADIAQLVALAKGRSNYPKSCRVYTTKNSTLKVLDVFSVLQQANLDQGLTLALQTLTAAPLKAIGRTNIKSSVYREILAEAHHRGITTYCDLILGLPEETYDSFLNCVDELLNLGQHDRLDVYHCLVLAGTRMSRTEYRGRYGIETVRTPLTQKHMSSDHIAASGIREYENVVVKTNTMSREDWIRTNVVVGMINTLHFHKVTALPSTFLKHQYGIRYRQFYEELIDTINPQSTPCLQAARNLNEMFYRSLAMGETKQLVFDEFGRTVWPVDEATFLLLSNDFDACLREISSTTQIVCKRLQVELDPAIWSDLLEYLSARIPRPSGPIVESFTVRWDWPAYFSAVWNLSHPELVARTRKLKVLDQHQANKTLHLFAKKVAWHARKRGDLLYHTHDIDTNSWVHSTNFE